VTGTGELHTPDGNGKLAVLLERSEAQQEFMRVATATLNRIERVQIENHEQLRARSVANSLAIENEASARKVADEMLNKKHDSDVAEINKKVDDLTAGFEKLKDKVADSVTLTRIVLFVLAALAIAVISAVVLGKIGIVINP